MWPAASWLGVYICNPGLNTICINTHLLKNDGHDVSNSLYHLLYYCIAIILCTIPKRKEKLSAYKTDRVLY